MAYVSIEAYSVVLDQTTLTLFVIEVGSKIFQQTTKHSTFVLIGTLKFKKNWVKK